MPNNGVLSLGGIQFPSSKVYGKLKVFQNQSPPITGYSQRVWRKNLETRPTINTNIRNLASRSNLSFDLFFSRYQNDAIVTHVKISCARRLSPNGKKSASNASIEKEKPNEVANLSVLSSFLMRVVKKTPGIKVIKKIMPVYNQ